MIAILQMGSLDNLLTENVGVTVSEDLPSDAYSLDEIRSMISIDLKLP